MRPSAYWAHLPGCERHVSVCAAKLEPRVMHQCSVSLQLLTCPHVNMNDHCLIAASLCQCCAENSCPSQCSFMFNWGHFLVLLGLWSPQQVGKHLKNDIETLQDLSLVVLAIIAGQGLGGDHAAAACLPSQAVHSLSNTCCLRNSTPLQCNQSAK